MIIELSIIDYIYNDHEQLNRKTFNLLGGIVTFKEGRFNGDVGEDETGGVIDVDGCCIGRTTATGTDD